MKISSIFVAFSENTNFNGIQVKQSRVTKELKFVFSEKATKNDEIFTVDLTLTT